MFANPVGSGALSMNQNFLQTIEIGCLMNEWQKPKVSDIIQAALNLVMKENCKLKFSTRLLIWRIQRWCVRFVKANPLQFFGAMYPTTTIQRPFLLSLSNVLLLKTLIITSTQWIGFRHALVRWYSMFKPSTDKFSLKREMNLFPNATKPLNSQTNLHHHLYVILSTFLVIHFPTNKEELGATSFLPKAPFGSLRSGWATTSYTTLFKEHQQHFSWSLALMKLQNLSRWNRSWTD